jgi:hypothetical protein
LGNRQKTNLGKLSLRNPLESSSPNRFGATVLKCWNKPLNTWLNSRNFRFTTATPLTGFSSRKVWWKICRS